MGWLASADADHSAHLATGWEVLPPSEVFVGLDSRASWLQWAGTTEDVRTPVIMGTDCALGDGSRSGMLNRVMKHLGVHFQPRRFYLPHDSLRSGRVQGSTMSQVADSSL